MNLGRQAQNEPEGVVEAVRVEAGVQSSRAVDETALVVGRVCIYLRAFSFQRHAGPPLLPLSYVAWHVKSSSTWLNNGSSGKPTSSFGVTYVTITEQYVQFFSARVRPDRRG